MNSIKKSGNIDGFSVKQLENNGTLEKKESALYFC